MRSKQKIRAIALALLLGAAIYGLLHTARVPSTRGTTGSVPGAAQGALLDPTPILTALKLAQMPTTAEELPNAQEALRIADHEMDLAYAAAEHELEIHPPPLGADAKKIQVRLKEAEDALDADNAQVARLTAEDAKATGARKDALDDQLVLATAHQGEHQDEVDDAKEDLARAGGDPNTRIEAMIQEHKASSQVIDSLKITVSAVAEEHGLIHRFSQWWVLHQKQVLLWQAKQQAESAAASLSVNHNALGAQLAAERMRVSPSAETASAAASSGGGETPANLSREDSAGLVKAARRRGASEKTLASLDKRIENQKKLAENYGKWIGVLAAEQRGVLHAALVGVTTILVILLIAIFLDTWLERLLGKLPLDRRLVGTLRTVTRVAVQVFAVLLILLVVFGPPGQLGTFLGLAGAGLTVALKDFIVAFLGWFTLMGKNGIRLGDWVEINGVTGEVVVLGLFYTVLLETGAWSEAGHPTGRRVTFTNGFAIEGHYFNFSTSRRWLWDELHIVVPEGRDPHPIVAAIRRELEESTAESARQAESEWKAARRSPQLATIAAGPSIHVKPVGGGVEIV